MKQGDIIKINFDPKSGHEQAGTRPAVVISNDYFNERAKMAIVCPVTNSSKGFPLHVKLDDRTKTTGVILCEHVRSLDVDNREYSFIEKMPEDILDTVIKTVTFEIKRPQEEPQCLQTKE